MSIQATFFTNVAVVETFSGPYTAGNANQITEQMNTSLTLNGTSTPPASLHSAFQKALVAGAGTIDLTALPGREGNTVTGNGLKVQALKLRNLAANGHNLTVVPGAANPYNLLGAAMSITLAPGQEVTINGNNATPAIGAGAKNLDVSGTGTEVLEVIVVMG